MLQIQQIRGSVCSLLSKLSDKFARRISMPLLRSSQSSTAQGLLKRDIGEVLDTISDPNIPAESVLGAGVLPSSPDGTKRHAARYFLSDRMLA